jgi:Ca-activated chloride channel family protein
VLKFAHPDHLWLLAVVPLLLVLWWSWYVWYRKTIRRIGDTSFVLSSLSGKKVWLKNSLIALGFILLGIVWANPQGGTKKQVATQSASDIFIVLDISQSMLCQDISPSRLELTKVFIRKLVQKLEGERIGLVFFAGNAFLQMPLSNDYTFVFQSIQSATPDMLSTQGTNIAAAIEIAQKSFDPQPEGGRMILILSDGETHEESTLKSVEDAFDDGTLICTVGVGTTSGGPIPLVGNGTYKRDENNEIVITKPNQAMLEKIASAGGGQLFNVSQGDAAVVTLKNIVDGLHKHAIEIRSLATLESYYQWFLLPAICLFVLDLFVSYNVKNNNTND